MGKQSKSKSEEETSSVYLFKDDYGQYAGYTDSKQVKKDVLRSRKKYKCIKVSKALAMQEHYIYEDDNKEFMYSYDNIPATAEEEEYFNISFEQFKSDMAYGYIEDIFKLIDILKLTKEEIMVFGKFAEFLIDFRTGYENGTIDESEYIGYDEYYNYRNAYKYFIKNVLGFELGE